MPGAWIDRRGDRWIVRYRSGGRESPKFYGGIFKRKADAVSRRRVIEHELACLRVPDIRALAAQTAKKTLTLGDAAETWRASRIDVPEQTRNMHRSSLGRVWKAAPALRCRPDAGAIERAAAILGSAERPLILAGGGVHLSGAAGALQAFSRAYNIPVAHTMSGKGAIACVDPLSAGLFGRYDRIANALIAEADALLVVGCKLGEIATKRYTVPPRGKRIIHLEIVAEEIGRTVTPEVALWGDALAGIEDLHTALSEDAAAVARRHQAHAADIARRMAAWRESVKERYGSQEVPVSMGRIMGELNRLMPADALLIADGGFAAHWGGLLYDTKQAGRGFVPDRGFASIGYGLPGAMGAALAARGRKVVSLTGDGGFNMMLGEIETARRLGLDFTVIVVNNAASGYVKALQHLMYGAGAYHASDLAETNYAAVAKALGCAGIRVEEPNAFAPALQEAFSLKGPVVLDVVVTRDPAKMLPAVDNRTVLVKKGDRVA